MSWSIKMSINPLQFHVGEGGDNKEQIFNIRGFVDFQALGPIFHLALEHYILKLEASSFGNRTSIYIFCVESVF